ncbi:MAG: phage protein Gp37 [Nitrospinota bacterium]
MYKIDELEDAIVSVLTAAGYDAAAFDDEPDYEKYAGLAKESPIVLVAFDGAEPAKPQTTLRKGIAFRFRLAVIARNLRGSYKAARGDATSSGIYAALDGLRSALVGNTLGLNAQPMVWLSENAQSRDPRLNVYRQSWSITVFE